MTEYVFFWSGPFSQWTKSPFTINGIEFNTCEQWMMYRKAVMFNDTPVAQAILETTDPNVQKGLGRIIKPFDDEVWMNDAYDIVVEGNRAKFIQTPHLLAELEKTKGKTLVEASPYDRRWGIGMRDNEPGVNDPANWKGENLLGKAITQVRIEIFGE